MIATRFHGPVIAAHHPYDFSGRPSDRCLGQPQSAFGLVFEFAPRQRRVRRSGRKRFGRRCALVAKPVVMESPSMAAAIMRTARSGRIGASSRLRQVVNVPTASPTPPSRESRSISRSPGAGGPRRDRRGRAASRRARGVDDADLGSSPEPPSNVDGIGYRRRFGRKWNIDRMHRAQTECFGAYRGIGGHVVSSR